jgi:uncharacterized protein YndB with AHSA1/START domain
VSVHAGEPIEVPGDPDALALTVALPGFSREVLFRHWIDPEALSRWWPPEADVDPRPGGRYHLRWPDMSWTLRGRITHFEPPGSLGFTWIWEHEPDTPITEVKVAIEPDLGGSCLYLTHGPYPNTDQGQQMRQGHLEGWMYFLPRLQALHRET